MMSSGREQNKYKADMKFILGVIVLVSLAVALVAYYFGI
jgi:hypothetical protein